MATTDTGQPDDRAVDNSVRCPIRVPAARSVRTGILAGMAATAIVSALGLSVASASAHPPAECRTALTNFAEQAGAFQEGNEATRPVLQRLFTAWDEVVEGESHAHRHAVIYRHFVAEFPLLMPRLADQTEAATQALHWARRAIFCLTRDR